MKPDKELVINVQDKDLRWWLEFFRAQGKDEDAQSMDSNIAFFVDVTNYTEEDVLALSLAEFNEMGMKVIAAMAEERDKAVPPTTDASSPSGDADTATESPGG